MSISCTDAVGLSSLHLKGHLVQTQHTQSYLHCSQAGAADLAERQALNRQKLEEYHTVKVTSSLDMECHGMT